MLACFVIKAMVEQNTDRNDNLAYTHTKHTHLPLSIICFLALSEHLLVPSTTNAVDTREATDLPAPPDNLPSQLRGPVRGLDIAQPSQWKHEICKEAGQQGGLWNKIAFQDVTKARKSGDDTLATEAQWVSMCCLWNWLVAFAHTFHFFCTASFFSFLLFVPSYVCEI